MEPILHIDEKPISDVKDDLVWFDEYYFGSTVDPVRRAAVLSRLGSGGTQP